MPPRLSCAAAQGLEAALAMGRCLPFISNRTLLIRKNRCDQFRRKQNAPDDDFPQGHFGVDAVVRQYSGCAVSMIKAVHAGGGQSRQLWPGMAVRTQLNGCAPLLAGAAAAFIPGEGDAAFPRASGQDHRSPAPIIGMADLCLAGIQLQSHGDTLLPLQRRKHSAAVSCSRKAQNTALSILTYYTHNPSVLQPSGKICGMNTGRICGMNHRFCKGLMNKVCKPYEDMQNHT